MIALKWVRSRDGRRALLVPAEADGLKDAPHVVFAVDRGTYAQNPLGVQQVIAARGYPPLPVEMGRALQIDAAKEEWLR
jgi:hypothetical protein